jgi:hypothetical protein
MGFGKTGIYGSQFTRDIISKRILEGATFITTGPYISINYTESPHKCAISKSTVDPSITHLWIYASSTPEFGKITQIKILCFQKEGIESIIYSKHCKETIYEFNELFDFEKIPNIRYIRAEVLCTSDNHTNTEAYTSACFF